MLSAQAFVSPVKGWIDGACQPQRKQGTSLRIPVLKSAGYTEWTAQAETSSRTREVKVLVPRPNRDKLGIDRVVHFQDASPHRRVKNAKPMSECGQGLPVFAAGKEPRTGQKGVTSSHWGNQTFVDAALSVPGIETMTRCITPIRISSTRTGKSAISVILQKWSGKMEARNPVGPVEWHTVPRGRHQNCPWAGHPSSWQRTLSR